MKPEETERLYIESLYNNSGISSKGEIEVDKLTGDASTRRYFRLLDSQKSYVVCLDDPIDENRRYPFEEVQEVLKSNGVRVPEIYYINRKKGFFLEEDLGNETFLETIGQAKTNDEISFYYKKIIDELVKIHKIDFKQYGDLPLAQLKFDHAKLQDETRITNHNFLVKMLNLNENDPLLNIIDQSFSSICSFLQTGKWFLTHRDFHSRNIMLKDGIPVIIDFQDARLGIAQYDLVSLLEDCYFHIDSKIKEDLIEYYKLKMDEDFDDFEKYYDHMKVQRLYKAIGSFSFIYNTRGDTRYLKFIGRSFESLLMTLGKYERYIELKLALSKIYYAS